MEDGIREEVVVSVSDVTVIMWGKVEGLKGVPMRVHDQCFTSEVLGSLKCDCKEQLDAAMDYIRDNPKGHGLVMYLQQEGRGIGLANKIKAYSVQELGYDTVDANKILGFHDDYREYHVVPQILNHLNVRSVELLTNNPRKIEHLRDHGVKIDKRIPCVPIAHDAALTHGNGHGHGHEHRLGHEHGHRHEQLGNGSGYKGEEGGGKGTHALAEDGGSVFSQKYLAAKQARMGQML